MATKKAAPKKTTGEFKAIRTKEHLITKKRSGRFLVTSTNGKTINGADKTKILLDAKLVSAGTPKAKEEAAAT